MSYQEECTQLAFEASVAVFVLGNPECTDVEFLPLKPRMADGQMLAELKARWPGRSLDSIGVIGLVGTAPQLALKGPLQPEQVSRLFGAFFTYLQALLADTFAGLAPAVNAPPRPEYDWVSRRYV